VLARVAKVLGSVRPAAMMISAGLADPRMKIEIEGHSAQAGGLVSRQGARA
jgi:hypothetical protein